MDAPDRLEMAAALSDRLGSENRILLLPLQLLLLGPLLAPLAVAGIRWLRSNHDEGARFRPLLWAYVAALILTFVSGGRPYYPLPLAVAVVVAGAVAAQTASRRWLAGLVATNALIALPLSLPLLPAEALARTPIGEINDTQVETIGWPQLVDDVAAVVERLPPDERDRVVLLAGTYGEAGALDRYGPTVGLPEVYSGHNSYWHWRRPRDDDATVVAVRVPGDLLDRHFQHCEQVATVDNGLGIDNEAQGQPVRVCRGLNGSWAEVWPAFGHYN